MRTVEGLLAELKALGVRFRLEEGRLKFSAPKGALNDALRAEMKSRKFDIITYLQNRVPDAFGKIPVIDRNQSVPLSFSQQRLWLMHQLVDRKQVYNVPCVWRLQGAVNVRALEKSLQQVVARHENLRTAFVESAGGELVQQIVPHVEVTLPLRDLRGAHENTIRNDIQHTIDLPFDLEHAPLLQPSLLRLEEDEYLLVLVMHHIVADGWSLDILVTELAAAYSAAIQGAAANLPVLPIQYADFAYWQRQRMERGEYDHQLSYWKQQLADAPAFLNLPADRPRPANQSFRGAMHEFTLPLTLAQRLKSLAAQTSTTLFMVLQTAFAVLLARYSGQDDILLGSPIANRNRVETEGLIGCFINTLVLRTRIDRERSFNDLLIQNRKMTLDAYAHQDFPFDLLVDALHPERTKSHSPLFQVMFVLHNTRADSLKLTGLKATPFMPKSEVSAFDLTLSMHEHAEGLTSIWEYATALFDAVTIQRMAEHFQILLEGATADPWQKIKYLPLLSNVERQTLLYDWNTAHHTDISHQGCLHQLFERKALQTPDAPAVRFAGDTLSYCELNARANQLAHVLETKGVQHDTLVGICVERSFETLIAMLGVLKAGAAYLPLDPNYPHDRLVYMLADAQVQLLLTQSDLAPRFTDRVSQCLSIDMLQWDDTLWNGLVSKSDVAPQHMAYVIYTSGSTGKPKGVMIPHTALVSRSLGMIDRYELKDTDHVLQFASFSFDVAAEEIFPTLLSGGCIVIAPQACLHSVQELVHLIRQEQLSVLNLPAPYWHEWVNQLKTLKVPESVRLLITGSDRVLRTRMQEWKQQVGERVPVYCGYGPTEATITSTLYTEYSLDTGMSDCMPIGRPLPDTQVYILDEHQQPVPIGVPGELYIAGAGLARGYLHREEQTGERFISNPFQRAHSTRMYRTGDLVRYLQDGNIEFLGRTDDQVKIRGFRIELGEISALLDQHASVEEAIVLAKEKQPGQYYLVAYVVLRASAKIILHPTSRLSFREENTLEANADWQRDVLKDLKAFCSKHLPDYMIPTTFMPLEEFPLSPSGKINARALPEPEIQTIQDFLPPRTETEIALAGIWREVLEVQDIGVYDNFFDLGGHSLLVTRLLHSVSELFAIDLSASSLFDYPVLEDFAKHINQARQGASDTVKAVDFHAEVWLDDYTVDLDQCFNVEVDSLRSIFITGATGFVGSFLLSELLEKTQARIHCLIRAKNEVEGIQRLQHSMSSHGLWDDAYYERLQIHPGDLALPRFGFSEDEFDQLAQQVDVIYHNGAWVNHVYPYSMLKAANVEGTREALRLACQQRVKPLHFVSSLSVFAPEITQMYEDAELDRPDLLFNGYVESKWVAEKLVSLAGKRGLPVTIHRVSRGCGVLQNGFTHVNDNYFRTVQTSVQLGIALDNPLGEDNLVPVDYAAKAIVYLSTQSNQLGKTFHIGNPHNTPEKATIEGLLKAGYAVRLLPPKQWQSEIVRQAKDSPEIGLHPLLPLFTSYDFEREPEHILFDCSNTLEGLKGSGIECPKITTDELSEYFLWLAKKGHLPSQAGDFCKMPMKAEG